MERRENSVAMNVSIEYRLCLLVRVKRWEEVAAFGRNFVIDFGWDVQACRIGGVANAGSSYKGEVRARL
jgi:hypothetical protein